MMAMHIPLGLTVILSILFLLSNKVKDTGLLLIALIVCLGVAVCVSQASYLGYIMIYLGVISVVVAIFFSFNLTREGGGGTKNRWLNIPSVLSGVFIAAIFSVMVLVIEKNKSSVDKSNLENISHDAIFASVKGEYSIPMEMMALSILISLVCIDIMSGVRKK